MVIVQRKNQLQEDKRIASFTVDYWGAKVNYEVWQKRTGESYCTGKDIHLAAKVLQIKANELFMAAQKKAKLAIPSLSIENTNGYTKGEFLPLGTHR